MTAADALDRLLALTVALGRDLSDGLAAQGLTESRAHLLFLLGQDGPTTQRDLAAALEVVPRTVTGLVDGLVASGHVTREPHPTDRRATLVTPTAAGAEAARGLVDGRVELAGQLFDDWPADDLARFAAGLERTLRRVERLVEESS